MRELRSEWLTKPNTEYSSLIGDKTLENRGNAPGKCQRTKPKSRIFSIWKNLGQNKSEASAHTICGVLSRNLHGVIEGVRLTLEGTSKMT